MWDLIIIYYTYEMTIFKSGTPVHNGLQYITLQLVNLTSVKTTDAVLQDKQGTSDTGLGQFVAARDAIFNK